MDTKHDGHIYISAEVSTRNITILSSFLPFSVEDVLSKDAGECAICLEELQQGDTIARLPCLCIYHKG